MKKIKIYIILCIACTCLFSCRTNWRENYDSKSKNPFGTYILHQEMKSLFEESKVKDITKYFDDFYYDPNTDFLDITGTSYISIRDKNYNFDDETLDALINHVEAGNSVFIAYNHFDDGLNNLLEIETVNSDSTSAYFSSTLKDLSGSLKLTGNDKVYEYDRNLRFHYIADYNSETTEVLGTIERDGESNPCFIQVKYNNGSIFLHTQPIAFTNYFLLKKENAEYTEKVFSKVGHSLVTYWDDSPKYKRNTDNSNKETALSFFMKHTTLRWSLLTGLFGLTAFILVNMRRKQRPIPNIEPLKNTTVEFTRTMANLYKKENNPKILIDKKISFFLHAVRQQYLLDTSRLDQQFIEKLAAKSGNSTKQTSILIKAISRLKELQTCEEYELIRLNKLIENFLNNKEYDGRYK